MNGWVVLLWSFVAALVLVVAGIFGSLVWMGRITLAPEAEATATPTPVQTGAIDTSFSVVILNATSEAGLGAQIQDELIKNGWSADTVFATESSRQDFAKTTVYYVNDDDELAAIGLAHLLGGAQVRQDDFYATINETDEKQLTVVIGLDRTKDASGASDEGSGQ